MFVCAPLYVFFCYTHNILHHNNISSFPHSMICLGFRYTNQTDAVQGSADLRSLRQDRPHPAEGVLWLHMLHHVDWSLNGGGLHTAGLTQGATNQKKRPLHKSQYFQFQLFSPRKTLKHGWSGTDTSFQRECKRTLQRSCGVFSMSRATFVLLCPICLSLSLDFLFVFVFILSLLSASLSPLLFSFLFIYLFLLFRPRGQGLKDRNSIAQDRHVLCTH